MFYSHSECAGAAGLDQTGLSSVYSAGSAAVGPEPEPNSGSRMYLESTSIPARESSFLSCLVLSLPPLKCQISTTF